MRERRTAPWAVGVVVPACNEETSIGCCLESILAACRASARCDQFWVVVVADGCSDRTSAIATAVLRGHGKVLECSVKSPGTARRLGALAVLSHFVGLDPAHIWLANTDADTRVPTDWVSTHLSFADCDTGAVAGIVELEPEGLGHDLRQLFARTYQVDPDGSHAHVHGANLGVRADAYLDVGGWSDVTVAEDHCLWSRLTQGGWRVKSSAASSVRTSARLQGRAQGGFADTLARELRAIE